MKVTCLLFGPVAESAGKDRVELSLGAAPRTADVLDALALEHPGLAGLLRTVALAVNGRYADPAGVLTDGDEVAVIPPVSGG